MIDANPATMECCNRCDLHRYVDDIHQAHEYLEYLRGLWEKIFPLTSRYSLELGRAALDPARKDAAGLGKLP